MKEIMNFNKKCVLFLAIGLVLVAGGCRQKSSQTKAHPFDKTEMSGQLKHFVAEKEAQANAAAKAEGKEVPAEFESFFAAAAKGDYPAVTNFFNDMAKRGPQYGNGGHDENMRGPMWQMVMETYGAIEQTTLGNEKYTATFGNDIIDSIPSGSIYFGGTDPGRFIVTALQKSHANGDPFFTLTQNALADGTYLDYLRSMYGGKIYIPTAEDSQKCFQDYTEDVTRRQQNNQLKPGEDVQVTGGRVQISGQVAVMGINGLLVKTIFDKNPDREFYIEESFPLDWMYPNLEPHDLIMKINRQPLADLSDEIVQNDTDYWIKYVTPMIGGWLDKDTPVKEVAAFAEKIYVKKDLGGFTGDPQFIQNEYSCKMFSKLRSAIASLYAWRAQHATSAAEKKRMNDAADFAFRQAFALCPYSPEAVYRYVNVLLREGRQPDAVLIVETASKMPEIKGQDFERQFLSVAKQLKENQRRN
jgi:hypothetical protein